MESKGVTTQMKALDEYFLMVVFVLLPNRICVFAICMSNSNREKWQWKGSSLFTLHVHAKHTRSDWSQYWTHSRSMPRPSLPSPTRWVSSISPVSREVPLPGLSEHIGARLAFSWIGGRREVRRKRLGAFRRLRILYVLGPDKRAWVNWANWAHPLLDPISIVD